MRRLQLGLAGLALVTIVSAACDEPRRRSNNDDDDGGGASAGTGGITGIGGAGVGGTAAGGAPVTSTGQGASGVGGDNVGAGPTECLSCGDVLDPVGGVRDQLCGDNGDGTCQPSSSCERLFSLIACACGDATVSGACTSVCGTGTGLCEGYVPPSTDCEACLTSECGLAYDACLDDA